MRRGNSTTYGDFAEDVLQAKRLERVEGIVSAVNVFGGS